MVFRDRVDATDSGVRTSAPGVQLVKGGVEPGENVRAAALRELEEETGIGDTGVVADLGTWDPGTTATSGRSNFAHFRSRNCPKAGHTIARKMAATTSGSSGTTWTGAGRGLEAQYRRALEAIRERTRRMRWRG